VQALAPQVEPAITDKTVCTATFDLQKVLICPSGKVGLIFYKRKLASYNLTVFELESKGHCFMWDESVAKRGSCEIASSMWKWLKGLPPSVVHVILYCDCCGGQNRNVQMVAMILSAVKCLPFLKIELKFLESGHTQMEVDSMHATIERASKTVDVFIPRDWQVIASTARRNRKPYNVACMQQPDVIDWKSVAKQLITNRSKTEVTGVSVNWTHLKWVEVSKGSATIRMKYELDESPFMELKYRGNSRGRIPEAETVKAMLKPLYSKPIPISKAKYNDLQELCQKQVIRSDFHSFYTNLVSSTGTRDMLEQSDVEDADECENDD
jgi:hypothetical protein